MHRQSCCPGQTIGHPALCHSYKNHTQRYYILPHTGHPAAARAPALQRASDGKPPCTTQGLKGSVPVSSALFGYDAGRANALQSPDPGFTTGRVFDNDCTGNTFR